MLDYSRKILGYIPRYYSASVAKLLETKKKISCHVYNVDKSQNCNECIRIIMEIRSQYGSVNPAAVVGSGTVATAVSTFVAVIFCKIMDRNRKK